MLDAMHPARSGGGGLGGKGGDGKGEGSGGEGEGGGRGDGGIGVGEGEGGGGEGESTMLLSGQSATLPVWTASSKLSGKYQVVVPKTNSSASPSGDCAVASSRSLNSGQLPSMHTATSGGDGVGDGGDGSGDGAGGGGAGWHVAAKSNKWPVAPSKRSVFCVLW